MAEAALAERSSQGAGRPPLLVVRDLEAWYGESHVLHGISFDVSDRAAVTAALEARLAEKGPYWGILLSAGITRDNAFPAIDGDDWDIVLRTNLDGFYNVVHPLTMPMIRRRDGGRCEHQPEKHALLHVGSPLVTRCPDTEPPPARPVSPTPGRSPARGRPAN